MSMKIPLTLAQHLNHCATAVLRSVRGRIFYFLPLRSFAFDHHGMDLIPLI